MPGARQTTSKILIGLPPSLELMVDREGYQHAVTGVNAETFVRRLVSLVFDFEEIMNSSSTAIKQTKRKHSTDDDDDQDALPKSKPLNPWKVDQILGKFSNVYLFLYELILLFSFLFY